MAHQAAGESGPGWAAGQDAAAGLGEPAAGAPGYLPVMPMGGGAGRQCGDEPARSTWLEEDRDVWGVTEVPALPPSVIGRLPDPATTWPQVRRHG